MKSLSQIAYIGILVSITFTVVRPCSAQEKCSQSLQKVDPQLIVNRGYPPQIAKRLARTYPAVAKRLLELSEADSQPVTLYRGEGVPISEYPVYGTVVDPNSDEVFLATSSLETATDYASPTITQLENADAKIKVFKGTLIQFLLPKGWLENLGSYYFKILRRDAPNPLIFTTDVGTVDLKVKDALINNSEHRVEFPKSKMIWHRFEEFFSDDTKLKKSGK